MIGEKLPQVIADDWSQDIRAFNTYGPAETAVVSTVRQFGAPGDEIQSENIGTPLPSVSAFVVRSGLPLMRHGVGELALGGPQLSKGYWNDQDMTAKRFVWNKRLARRLYMTGDLVRQLHDGSIVFVGREDDLIKIQGIRVELSEISFSLRCCHPLVEHIETQYFGRKDRPSKAIVAFLVASGLDANHNGLATLENASPIAKSALLEARNNLPDYMIPRVFLVVKSIPRTPSNKIDKIALQKIYESTDLVKWESALTTTDGTNREAKDWTQSESSIIAAIAEVSGSCQDSMSRLSDLRSLGIDSIAATKLAPTLATRGHSVSIANILQCQTLNDLVKIIGTPGSSGSLFDLKAFHSHWHDRVSKKVGRDDFVVAPALPLQESLLSESMQTAYAYWSNTFLSLDAQVNLSRLHEAWLQVLSGTEALRTGFIPSAAVLDGVIDSRTFFLQLIYGKADVDWTSIETPEGRLRDIALQHAQQ